jgi:excinuclease ABC subunit C
MADRQAKLTALAAKARTLPKVPGVYLMQDDKGRVIYVGKARVLPNRVSSYFQPAADLGPKKQPMIDLVEDFDVIECESEWEALLTEARLIKDTHPRFNERLSDDKTFPYLVITVRDDFAGVFITREPTNPAYRGAKVFGPFTSVYALRDSIKLLQRVFKFRTCTLDIRDDDDQRRFFRPCLLHAIGQCTAPCAAKIDRQAYRDDIQRLIRFLESKRSVMLRQMRQEMAEAAEQRDYERAATLRDQIQAIERLDDRGTRRQRWQPETEVNPIDPERAIASLQKALGMDREPRCIDCIDIAHLQGGQTVGSKVCFIDGRPYKQAYRRYKIRTAENDDYMAIREVVSRAYRDAGSDQALYPDLVIIDGGAGQLAAALQAVADFKVKPPMLIALAKKQEMIYLPEHDEPLRLSRNHLGLRLCQAIRDEAHRFAQHYHHILRRKKTLNES